MAVPLALLNAGLAFVYLGRLKAAVLYVLAAPLLLAPLLTPLLEWRFGAIALGVWQVGIVASFFVWAVVVARRTRTIQRPRWVGVLGYTSVIAVSLMMTMFIRPSAELLLPYRVMSVSSDAMGPTALKGDYLTIKRINATGVSQGDVVFFFNANNLDLNGKPWLYANRLIAKGGQSVSMRDGRLVVDGEVVPRRSLGTDDDGGVLYLETAPSGAEYTIREWLGDDGRLDNTQEFHVPEGYLFFLGDNRDNSVDSRSMTVGFVPETAVYGKALLIGFSTDDWTRTGRRIQ